jgi:type I restriction-modification system DNA methylase subunit
MPNEEKPTIPKVILDLVERFERNREAYKSGHYNETQVRREFLDPFFKELGWDIDNEQGYAEDYKDVIHEDAIKTTDGTKAPDYCFRIGGTRKFFLEAKRPSVDIKNDVSPAFQLRRYGFTTKLPLNVLSDFEEFAVYDSRFKPDKRDSAAVGRILYIPYTEYATRWHEIAAVFSREAVLKGSFDEFAESSKAKRGTADVDDAFLETIETWRKELAQNLALRNQELSQRQLNFAVQSIIDRIIFLRICEGRGIEDYGRLRALTDGDKIYPRLGKLFEQADDRYNSGLFHFRAEKGRHEAPDELTLKLDLDDKLLRDILKNLYYPDSPYVFSALSANVLGQVYEQFLGKVIRLTEGHQAKVDDKPEVKKAGGVFYTPTYIGEYIVQNTVGKLLDEIVAAVCDRRKASDKPDGGPRPPLQLNARQATKILARAAKLRILDLACGSGSLLLCAYEHLLKWHLDFYTRNDPAKWAKGSQPVLVQISGGGWKLTITERKRILLDNIYGVDIDAQAVETTKLSLLLKVLEGETSQTIQPELLHERALPDLCNNINCGNSLIGPDFYQQQQMTLLTQDERDRVNTFDWHAEFPEVFKAGGFDALIGNPPYVRPHNLQTEDKNYFWAIYKTFTHKSDLYCCFIERAMSLLRPGGLFSFIVSHGWLRLNSFQELRRFILNNSKIHTLVELPFRVFENAVVDTGIFVLERGKADSRHKLTVVEGKIDGGFPKFMEKKKLAQSAFQKTFQNVFDLSISPETESIKDKMRKGDSLGKFYDICFGLKTAADDKFLHFSKGLHKEDKALLRGDDLKRYATNYKGEFVWYVPDRMRRNKSTARPGEPARFEQPKVLVKDTSKDFGCTYDADGFYVKDVLIVIPKSDVKAPLDLRFIAGLLNSRLMFFYYRTTFPTLHVQNGELASLPLPKLNASDKSRHDQMVKLVEQMLALHQSLAAAKTPPEKTALARQNAATDTQIDALVYELYGLTEAEIKLVEDSAK